MRVVLVLSVVLVSACSSPTAPAPTPAPVPSVLTVVPPAPEPVAPIPAPAPDPPQPPVVVAPVAVVWTAHTDVAHWFGPALLPPTFSIERLPDALLCDRTLRIPIVFEQGGEIIARTSDLTLTVGGFGGPNAWSFVGVAGQAGGTLVR